VKFFAVGLLLIPLCASAKAPSKTAEAMKHYQAGVTHYKAAEYDDAVTEFQAAYELKPTPEWLFNLASAHRMAKHPEKALAYYERYLDEVPDAPNKVQVEQRIAEMKAMLAPPPPTPEPVRPAAPAAAVAAPAPSAAVDLDAPKTPYELGIRARYLFVTSQMLAPYLKAETQMLRAFSVGAEFVWHRRTYDVVTSLDFSWLNVDDGNYLGGGNDPTLDTQYTQFRNLSFISADVAVIGHYDVTSWFQFRGGAGIGIGAVLGDVLLTHNGPNCGTAGVSPGDTTKCYPGSGLTPSPASTTGPINNGYANPQQETTLQNNMGPNKDSNTAPSRHVSKDKPPAMAVINILVGARFNLPRKFTIDVELGFRDAMFVGVGAHYKF
jgi:hypothetical protein